MNLEGHSVTPSGGGGTPLRVVIADDAVGIRILLRGMLEKARIFAVVAEAGTGLEAIECVEEHRPDLVLLDMAMPEMDGLQALPEIRRLVPDARIVVISGFDPATMQAEAIRRGADRYVPKGASVGATLGVLHEVLGERARGMIVPEPPPPSTGQAGGPDVADPPRRGRRRRSRPG